MQLRKPPSAKQLAARQAFGARRASAKERAERVCSGLEPLAFWYVIDRQEWCKPVISGDTIECLIKFTDGRNRAVTWSASKGLLKFEGEGVMDDAAKALIGSPEVKAALMKALGASVTAVLKPAARSQEPGSYRPAKAPETPAKALTHLAPRFQQIFKDGVLDCYGHIDNGPALQILFDGENTVEKHTGAPLTVSPALLSELNRLYAVHVAS